MTTGASRAQIRAALKKHSAMPSLGVCFNVCMCAMQCATRGLQVHMVAVCDMAPARSESAEFCCRVVAISAAAVAAAAAPALLPLPLPALLRGAVHRGAVVLTCRVVAVLLLPLLLDSLARARQARLRDLTILAAGALPYIPIRTLLSPSWPVSPSPICVGPLHMHPGLHD